MSKKIEIGSPRKHLPESADRWVGANPTQRLTVDLPPDLHAKFKAKAAFNKKSLTKVVVEMIKGYVGT